MGKRQTLSATAGKFKIVQKKGVLAKDNKTPFAPATLFIGRMEKHPALDCEAMWKSPIDYSMKNVVHAMLSLMQGSINEVDLIDANNDQITVTRV